MKLLEMNHVKKSFDGLMVIQDISLSVEKGEIVSIIGPSGSGKSTLLRCATMLETMDSGELIYLGEKAAWSGADGKMIYAHKKDLRRIRENYGLVFQNFNLFPHFSVLKNIMDAPVSVQKKSKEEAHKTAMELLKKMGLEDKAEAYPCQLSGGQCQRVAIARALINQPEVLLADEPTGNLDHQNAVEIMKLLLDINQMGTTVVVVTHSQEIVEQIGGRVITMDRGRVISDEIKDGSSHAD